MPSAEQILGPLCIEGTFMWDKEMALNHLNFHAEPRSLGRCAEYVRRAVEAGGIILRRNSAAKDYGQSLIIAGFRELHDPHSPRKGDIAVIEPIPGHPFGHMAMFNGEIWVSDFRQYHGFYPGPTYRKLKPSYKLYRYD